MSRREPRREKSSRPDRPSDERSLDALLEGSPLPDGDLARWQPVSQVLTALTSVPASSELSGEARALAEFRVRPLHGRAAARLAGAAPGRTGAPRHRAAPRHPAARAEARGGGGDRRRADRRVSRGGLRRGPARPGPAAGSLHHRRARGRPGPVGRPGPRPLLAPGDHGRPGQCGVRSRIAPDGPPDAPRLRVRLATPPAGLRLPVRHGERPAARPLVARPPGARPPRVGQPRPGQPSTGQSSTGQSGPVRQPQRFPHARADPAAVALGEPRPLGRCDPVAVGRGQHHRGVRTAPSA